MDKYLSTADCNVFYEHLSHPKNPKTLVFIHGYAIDNTMWQPQIDFFQDRYSIINIDVRGHGKSRPSGIFNIDQVAADVLAILAQEKCTDFILIGLSLGGYIIQEFAFRHGKARAYIISGSTPMFLDCYSKLELYGLRHAGQMLRAYPWNYLKNLMAKTCAVKEEARLKTLAMFEGLNREEFIRSWSGVADSVRLEQMSFDAPLLVLYGDSDEVGTIKKCSKYWCEAYDNCQLVELKNASHMANLDATEEFNSVVDEFIAKIG
jgi:3-oxoadipate enol-lactonase